MYQIWYKGFLTDGQVSFSNESNKTYLSASVSNFLIADFKDGSLFCDKQKYRSLKYGLNRYPA